MRAIRARYNPYVQARARVDQLRKLGHSVDKVCLTLLLGRVTVGLVLLFTKSRSSRSTLLRRVPAESEYEWSFQQFTL